MKALCLRNSVTVALLCACDRPTPQPAPGEVLIQVHAAAVTPTELLWYPTTHTKEGTPRLDPIPAHEFSGTITAVAEGTLNTLIGQEVYGLNDWFADGAAAEYCLTRPEWIAPKPTRLTHAEAASAPISALTAWQGLYDRAKLQPGERILIHGGSGAVGLYAIQLARRVGAEILTTASSRHADYLRTLGATKVIDYHTARFEDQARDADVIFDTVGGETLQRSWPLLKPNGRLVTIATQSEDATDDRTKAAFFIVETKRDQLEQIATLFDRGELQPCVDNIITLDLAPAAYLNQLPRTQGRGKVVINLAND